MPRVDGDRCELCDVCTRSNSPATVRPSCAYGLSCAGQAVGQADRDVTVVGWLAGWLAGFALAFTHARTHARTLRVPLLSASSVAKCALVFSLKSARKMRQGGRRAVSQGGRWRMPGGGGRRKAGGVRQRYCEHKPIQRTFRGDVALGIWRQLGQVGVDVVVRVLQLLQVQLHLRAGRLDHHACAVRERGEGL